MAKRVKKPAQDLSKLRRQAEQEAGALGLELVELAVARENAGSVMRFTIDKPGGVSLDDCEAFHRRALKFVGDDIDYDYMEVTSPGADRPLKTERDFEGALGLPVEAGFYRQLDGQKRMTGELKAWDKDFVTLLTSAGERRIARADISQIRLYVDEAELDSPAFDELEAAALAEEAEGADLDDGGNDGA